MSATCGIRFADYHFDRATGVLWHNDQVVKLQPQPMAVLRALLEKQGEIVTREELRDRIWGSATHVDFDQGLNFCIRQIRVALNENAGQPQYIETFPKLGYRFIGMVESVDKSAPASADGDGPEHGNERPADHTADSGAPVSASVWKLRATWTGVGILATLLVVSTAGLLRGNLATPRTEFPIPPPENGAFGGLPTPAISPDGRRIVFAVLSQGGAQLWLRSLESLTAIPLPGTEEYPGVISPFWSPDSRSIGFFAGGKLKKIEVVGPSGPSLPVTLCDAAPTLNGGSWNRRGVIVFAADGLLYRVPDTGGIPVPIARQNQSNPRLRRICPWFLPDGEHFLFEEVNFSPPPDPLLHPGRATIRVGSLNSMETKAVRESDSNALFARDSLVFLLETTLMAQRFDTRRLAVVGDAVPLADQVFPADAMSYRVPFSASEDLLAYRPGAGTRFEFSWFDRAGNRLSTSSDDTLSDRYSMELSPDERTVALRVRENHNTDIWLYDPVKWSRTRFTSSPAIEAHAIWSPDGQSIAFSSNRQGHFDLYRRPINGRDAEQLLFADDHDKYPTSWSPDGRFLLYDKADVVDSQVWVLPLAAQRGQAPIPFPFLQTGSESARFSPDGKWIVFAATEAGESEVFLAPFASEGPYSGAKVQVSSAGGFAPRWRRDGKEIFFVSGRHLMAASVEMKQGTPQIGQPHAIITGVSIQGYDVSADGQRILVAAQSRAGSSQPLIVAQNWSVPRKPMFPFIHF